MAMLEENKIKKEHLRYKICLAVSLRDTKLIKLLDKMLLIRLFSNLKASLPNSPNGRYKSKLNMRRIEYY